MTDVRTYKNEYGYKVADCPFCEHWVYVRDSTKVSPDPLRDLKRHITNAAKNEAFESAIAKDTMPTPHLDYVRDHTSVRPKVPKVEKRQYDDDLRPIP